MIYLTTQNLRASQQNASATAQVSDLSSTPWAYEQSSTFNVALRDP
jgi:hypothetical protein